MLKQLLKISGIIIIVFVIARVGKKTVIEPRTGYEWQKRKVFFAKNYGRETRADFNNDGIVNMKDFAILANQWLESD